MTVKTNNGEDVRPGLAPGGRGVASTVFVALYGGLTPHPWRSSDSDRDPYLVFHELSVAMGWLGDRGLWSMNDAGRHHPLADESLVAWFQVDAEPVAGDRPLPVQPLLRCAVDAMARLGRLTVDAVQVLLPVQCLDAASRPQLTRSPSLLTAAWFDDSDPSSRTPVRVTLDGGQSPDVRSIVAGLASLDQSVFVAESHTAGQSGIRPLCHDSLWNGPPQHAVTVTGVLAEWSPEAIGWLAAFMADVSIRHGITTPLLFTARRT